MKKIMLVISVIALMFIVNSCNKENDSVKDQSVKQINANIAGTWGIHRQYFSWINDCSWPPVNCFDDIVVTPAIGYAFNDLNDSISVGSVSAVSNYFNGTEWSVLLPDLASPQLDSLQNGTFTLVRVNKSPAKEFCFALPPGVSADSANLVNYGGFLLVFNH